ncbi:uncharacterized protein BDR25DRAFT_357378 [Lindgomyces ingoldianus]|uniref:Uncharacterized protein n=1 Tax=Lindgomyces ingoldianus TaxID=673940 RepID=A0ACB6QN85_9PLEO|nr:uncharacterized protein BDR25DRAFT_357378 [Lindgomyces ingoldianus]KAF2468448.1 hypothetical protein BDR25DRAFT_357378 [Lindgomyces ingoldianus]
MELVETQKWRRLKLQRTVTLVPAPTYHFCSPQCSLPGIAPKLTDNSRFEENYNAWHLPPSCKTSRTIFPILCEYHKTVVLILAKRFVTNTLNMRAYSALDNEAGVQRDGNLIIVSFSRGLLVQICSRAGVFGKLVRILAQDTEYDCCLGFNNPKLPSPIYQYYNQIYIFRGPAFAAFNRSPVTRVTWFKFLADATPK